MSQDKVEIYIPECYLWLTEGYHDREKLFKGYVEGYINNNFPRLVFVKIDGMKAICERRKNNG